MPVGNYWHPLWETDGKDYFHKQSFSLLPPYLIWLGVSSFEYSFYGVRIILLDSNLYSIVRKLISSSHLFILRSMPPFSK